MIRSNQQEPSANLRTLTLRERLHPFFIALIALNIVLWDPAPAKAEAVPRHLVHMSVDLLRGVKEDLRSPSADDQEGAVKPRIYRILRQEGLYHWAGVGFKREGVAQKLAAVFGIASVGAGDIPRLQQFLESQIGGRRDAALDELFTAYNRQRPIGAARSKIITDLKQLWQEAWGSLAMSFDIEGARGPHRIILDWRLDDARFTILVEERSDETAPLTQFEIAGDVRFTVAENGNDIEISVRALANPFRIKAQQDVAIGPGRRTGGRNDPGASGKSATEKAIANREKRIDDIKSDKTYIWTNTETGEIVRQERFKKLKAPFDYKGEGYSEPDADDEIKRLEREIAELEGHTPPAGTETTRTESAEEAPSQPEDVSQASDASLSEEPLAVKGADIRGPFFSFSKKVYFHDEPVVVTLFNDWRSAAVDLRLVNYVSLPGESMAGRGYYVNINTPPGENVVKFWPGLSRRHKPFTDYSIAYRTKLGWLFAGFIRIIRRDGLLPGAVKIVGGERQAYGKELTVEVDIPDELIADSGEANRDDKRNFFLDIVTAGQRVRGGAVQTAKHIKSFPIKASHSRFNISEYVYSYVGAGSPGLYHINLRADEFVVDRARLLLTVDALPGSLQLLTPEPLTAGEAFSVVFDAPPLQSGLAYHIDFIRLMENGRAQRLSKYSPTFVGVEPGAPVDFPGAVIGGRYLIRLILSNAWTDYIVDSLALQIGARKSEPDSLEFSIAGTHMTRGKVVAAEGKQVLVEVFLPIWNTDDDNVYARLYRVEKSSRNTTFEIVPTGSPIGDPVKEWPIQLGRKMAWTIGEDLTTGSYALTIPAGPTQQMVRYIQITPKFSAVKLSLGGKYRFRYGESLPLSVVIPGALSSFTPELLSSGLGLEIKKVGGYVPGCAIESPLGADLGDSFHMIIKSTTELESPTLLPLREVGLYMMRLSHPAGAILDEITFEVVSELLPDAISLRDGPRYVRNTRKSMPPRSEGLVDARISLPADHPLATEQEGYTYPLTGFFYHGAIADGGAALFPEIAIGGVARGGKFPLELNGSQGNVEGYFISPGSYEFRLFHSYPNDREVLIASDLFTVVDDASPFPLSYGLKSVSLRNDLIAPNNPWPPVGEYLDGDNCDPEMVPPERMDLRFVRWDNGEYLPVGHALEFGEAFYIEGRLKDPATKHSYLARVAGPDGQEEEVALFRTEDDPKIVRSELLYFVWETPEQVGDVAQ